MSVSFFASTEAFAMFFALIAFFLIITLCRFVATVIPPKDFRRPTFPFMSRSEIFESNVSHKSIWL
jgi:hypothetical protein